MTRGREGVCMMWVTDGKEEWWLFYNDAEARKGSRSGVPEEYE